MDEVTAHLALSGIRAIQGNQYSPEEIRSRRWVLERIPRELDSMVPRVAEFNTRTDGSISVRF